MNGSSADIWLSLCSLSQLITATFILAAGNKTNCPLRNYQESGVDFLSQIQYGQTICYCYLCHHGFQRKKKSHDTEIMGKIENNSLHK